MAIRIGIVVLLLLSANWACDARQLANSSDTRIRYNRQEVSGNEKLEVIEMLLRACKSLEKYAQCKRMVFKYGPVILANAEQFLETTDICTALHASNSTKAGIEDVSLSSAEISLSSDT